MIEFSGKPCPFCGSTKMYTRQGSSFRWRVAECAECLACASEARRQTFGEGTDEGWDQKAHEDAVAAWNKRSLPVPVTHV